LALLFFPPLGWQLSLLYSLIVAVLATVVEAVSIWHIDNLTVPLLSALLLYLLAR
ncbi:MAG: phosphatidate cytidylyltransferase, partial [Anaerolineae bacterium]|nr:phosphatidate cytidylyltransferase [Anaerolineae bacterium]